MKRNHSQQMPSKFEPLGLYNAERHRGIAHTREWDVAMVVLQREFNEWQRELWANDPNAVLVAGRQDATYQP